MSTSNFSIPVNVQMGVISANLNVSMLFNFLFGLYTMVYSGTMYLYLSKKNAGVNRRIVLSAITVLYLLCFLVFILDWYAANWLLVINGSTRESIFISSLEGGPPWIDEPLRALFYVAFIVSDGLLIWRCYHVWGQSFRVVSIPLTLLFVEFILFALVTILGAMISEFTSQVHILDNVASALAFVSLGTTITTTFLIGYRIHATSRLNGSPLTKLYIHIANLVIESAAVYSLVLLSYAIYVAIPACNTVDNRCNQAGCYLTAAVIIVPGLVPTITVARLALVNLNNTVNLTVTHISGLQSDYQHTSGHNGITSNIVHTPTVRDAPPALGGEERKSIVDGNRDGYQVECV